MQNAYFFISCWEIKTMGLCAYTPSFFSLIFRAIFFVVPPGDAIHKRRLVETLKKYIYLYYILCVFL